MPYADPETRRAFHRQYMRQYRKRPAVKRKEKAAFQRYCEENRDARNATQYRWREVNPTAWRQIKRRAERRRHQHKKSGYEGVSVVNTVIEVVYEFRDVCTSATGVEHHVDHMRPLSKGGLHVPWNLQVLTAKANLMKATRVG